MAVIVREIMNEELCAIELLDTVADAVTKIVTFQITAAPVLDERRRPRGMVTLRELLDAPCGRKAAECATPEFAVILASDSLTVAAHKMADCGKQQLVVVDVDGGAIGIVSAFDLVRALVGAPVTRPEAFPHFDVGAGVSFSDDVPLDSVHAARAPNAAGVVALVLGGATKSEHVMWAEACGNVRHRLDELLRRPIHEIPALAAALASGHLRFRAAVVQGRVERERVLAVVLGRAMAKLNRTVAGFA